MHATYMCHLDDSLAQWLDVGHNQRNYSTQGPVSSVMGDH